VRKTVSEAASGDWESSVADSYELFSCLTVQLNLESFMAQSVNTFFSCGFGRVFVERSFSFSIFLQLLHDLCQ